MPVPRPPPNAPSIGSATSGTTRCSGIASAICRWGSTRTSATNVMAEGVDPQTASRMAAHWANRFAGALPQEAMSANATKVANMLLFSRTFTMGNLGVMKDMLGGLPKDVLAQIERDAGELNPEAAGFAKSMARRRAMAVVVGDILLMHVGNSILQSASNVMLLDRNMDDEWHRYVERFHAAMREPREHPMKLLQPLAYWMNSARPRKTSLGNKTASRSAMPRTAPPSMPATRSARSAKNLKAWSAANCPT